MPDPVHIASMGSVESANEVDIQAARDGRGLHKWVNDKTPGATEVVLTDATLYYDIPPGKQALIRKSWVALNTVSDSVHGNLVSCDRAAGAGTCTDLDGHMEVHSSGNLAGNEHYERNYRVPICVKYSSGARSISMRMDANDAGTGLSCGWQGWVENES